MTLFGNPSTWIIYLMFGSAVCCVLAAMFAVAEYLEGRSK